MSGLDISTVSKFVGHASSRMIDQVYGHLTPKFRAEQMGRIKFDIGANGAGENGDQRASKTA